MITQAAKRRPGRRRGHNSGRKPQFSGPCWQVPRRRRSQKPGDAGRDGLIGLTSNEAGLGGLLPPLAAGLKSSFSLPSTICYLLSHACSIHICDSLPHNAIISPPLVYILGHVHILLPLPSCNTSPSQLCIINEKKEILYVRFGLLATDKQLPGPSTVVYCLPAPVTRLQRRLQHVPADSHLPDVTCCT